MKKVWDTSQVLEYADNNFGEVAEKKFYLEKNEIQSEIFRSTEHFTSPSEKEPVAIYDPELPVNNYLKTRQEIEAEFRFIASSGKAELQEKETPSATYGRIVKIVESYSYLHSIDQALSEPLEENY